MTRKSIKGERARGAAAPCTGAAGQQVSGCRDAGTKLCRFPGSSNVSVTLVAPKGAQKSSDKKPSDRQEKVRRFSKFKKSCLPLIQGEMKPAERTGLRDVKAPPAALLPLRVRGELVVLAATSVRW